MEPEGGKKPGRKPGNGGKKPGEGEGGKKPGRKPGDGGKKPGDGEGGRPGKPGWPRKPGEGEGGDGEDEDEDEDEDEVDWDNPWCGKCKVFKHICEWMPKWRKCKKLDMICSKCTGLNATALVEEEAEKDADGFNAGHDAVNEQEADELSELLQGETESQQPGGRAERAAPGRDR